MILYKYYAFEKEMEENVTKFGNSLHIPKEHFFVTDVYSVYITHRSWKGVHPLSSSMDINGWFSFVKEKLFRRKKRLMLRNSNHFPYNFKLFCDKIIYHQQKDYENPAY